MSPRRPDRHDEWLSDAAWATVQQTVPIACVDVVPVLRDGSSHLIGLIRRTTPFDGRVLWCQIGGRIRFGETVRAAVLRHLHETIAGVAVDLPLDPQPDYVMQWFPEPQPSSRVAYGVDPRRHAVALSFLVELTGLPEPVPAGEADEFAWLDPGQLAAMQSETWPGTISLLEALGLLI